MIKYLIEILRIFNLIAQKNNFQKFYIYQTNFPTIYT